MDGDLITCSRCGVKLTQAGFYKMRKWSGVCKECHKKRVSNNRRKRVAEGGSDPIDGKTCPTCGVYVPASGFQNDRASGNGLSYECMLCTRTRKHGLDGNAVRAMMVAQGGKCAGCKRDIEYNGKWANVACIDHCHITGVVRGLLCHLCNRAIGLAGDSPITLRSLAEYLERSQIETVA
jgi:hypothetical protein